MAVDDDVDDGAGGCVDVAVAVDVEVLLPPVPQAISSVARIRLHNTRVVQREQCFKRISMI
jgi:hypothetical protein